MTKYNVDNCPNNGNCEFCRVFDECDHPHMDDKEKANDAILYDTTDGKKMVRCECGCNVFRKKGEQDGVHSYICNSCGSIVKGTK